MFYLYYKIVSNLDSEWNGECIGFTIKCFFYTYTRFRVIEMPDL